MTGVGRSAALIGGVTLLERAIAYTHGSLRLVTPAALSAPTPCHDWDLRALLAHMNDSLLAVHEAIVSGHVGLTVPDPDVDPSTDPVAALRSRACTLLGAVTAAEDDAAVTIADHALTRSVVTGAGALEIAVHGWDVAESCGGGHPIPSALADELLDLAPLLVTPDDRPTRFADALGVPPSAAPSTRLLAFLGRPVD